VHNRLPDIFGQLHGTWLIFSLFGNFIPLKKILWQNLVLNVAESQLNKTLLDSNGSTNSMGRILNNLDVLFTCIFTAELLLNAFAHWFW
jgi:hypothetical protein